MPNPQAGEPSLVVCLQLLGNKHYKDDKVMLSMENYKNVHMVMSTMFLKEKP
jgi:hypothetical protein